MVDMEGDEILVFRSVQVQCSMEGRCCRVFLSLLLVLLVWGLVSFQVPNFRSGCKSAPRPVVQVI